MHVLSCFGLLTFASTLFFAGCSPHNPLGRQSVTGEVTLQGQPLDRGTIEFSPQAAGGVQSGALIAQGRFLLETQHGLPPGKYTVRIFSASSPAENATSAPPGPLGPPAVRDRIPAQYNTQSVETFEVVAGTPATYRLDIP